MKEFWLKAKAFLTKKWLGIPVYGWFALPLVLIVFIYSYLSNRPKTNKF